LLFSAQLDGRPALLYFLYEHQSSHDIFMPLRLLDYCVRAWNDWRRKHPEASSHPAIVPVVLHHSDRGWSGSTRFAELLDLDHEARDALAPHLVDSQFLLDDLTQQSDDQIHARALTALAEIVALAFKHLPYEPDPLAVLETLAPLMLHVIGEPNGPAALSAVLRYVLQVSEVEIAPLKTLVGRRLGQPGEEAVMSTAEKLEQQGIAKGKSEGRAEGEAKVLLKLLTLKFGPLPDGVARRVQAASVEELDRWTERVLSAKSLAEVFADKPAPKPSAKRKR